MSIFHEREIAKARKEHACDWCGDDIKMAHPYRLYRWAEESDSGLAKMHPECYEAMQSDTYVERDRYFNPHNHCRGCSCERGRCECNAGQQQETRDAK